MYSWSGIGVPTTKAIIRESARLVNLTLGRAGFFICSAGSYAEGDLWNRLASPSEYVPRYPEVKGRVVFSDENLHPYALDFWIFLGYSVYADGTRNFRFPSRRLRQYTPKTAFFSVPNPLIWASASAVAAADHALAA